MNEIFISYASEDRQRAQRLAASLSARGWDIWWDREIPLGKSYDDVIEKAMAQAKCVIVLWSAVSIASEWVRNEASDGRRRGILVPVFIEHVEAPLAFRLLNGADLTGWSGDVGDAEFVRLVERVSELLAGADSRSPVDAAASMQARPTPASKGIDPKRRVTPWLFGALAFAVVGAGIGGYLLRGGGSAPRPQEPVTQGVGPAVGANDMEKASATWLARSAA